MESRSEEGSIVDLEPSANQDFQLSDIAYATLSRALARCELAPGAFLNEREVSARLGMSRTPLRQALHRLALEGLVVILPRRGVQVTFLDLDDIRANLEVREALEVAALRKVLQERRGINKSHFEKLVRRMQWAARGDDPPEYLEADEGFHLGLAAAAGNSRALEVLQRAWVHINRARYLQTPTRREMSMGTQQHSEVLKAVVAGDRRQAIDAMRSHLQSALQLFEDLAQKHPGSFQSPPARDEGAPQIP